GVVADLSSGRRWVAAAGGGARRDGRPVTPRPGTTVVVPTAPSGGTVGVPSTARRVRITGCTAVDVCLVADGSAAAWHNLDGRGRRGGGHRRRPRPGARAAHRAADAVRRGRHPRGGRGAGRRGVLAGAGGGLPHRGQQRLALVHRGAGPAVAAAQRDLGGVDG